ncbi:hypothetical protein ACFLTU_05305 [Bacteroidota bacterium]
MKNLVFIVSILLLVSCSSKETETSTTPVERSIGFATALPDNKFHLGTEEAIQVVKDLDKVWAQRDYEGMKTFFVDTAKFFFPDGRIAKSPDEFIENLKADDEGTEDSWTFDYAFSVDLDPTMGGEHVQAGFTGTSVKDGVETKKRYHESYYIIDGKIVWCNQYTMVIRDE